MITKVLNDWRSRPWWMNLIFYFCLYMTILYMPFDLFYKPVAQDEEIWFGFTLTGWWAKATEPLHWLIYGFGAYGFWQRKAWMWPWAAVYSMQVVIAMVVWNFLRADGAGLIGGLVAGGLFLIPTWALWRSKTIFQPNQDTDSLQTTTK